MLKLTLDQIHEAMRLAEEITNLEASKDRVKGAQCRVGVMLIDVPQEMVRAELAKRLSAATDFLAALGIELAP